MGYLETMAKIENNKELTEEDKLECVADVIKIRLNVKLTKNDKIVKMISDKVGSMWTDTPMPVASQDIPDAIIDFYYEHMAG
jgi:hypothetical protein